MREELLHGWDMWWVQQVFKAVIEATFKGVSKDLWVSKTERKPPED